jgi:hypothetical protein
VAVKQLKQKNTKTQKRGPPLRRAAAREVSFFSLFCFCDFVAPRRARRRKKSHRRCPVKREGPTKADHPENPASQKETPAKHTEKYTGKWR